MQCSLTARLAWRYNSILATLAGLPSVSRFARSEPAALHSRPTLHSRDVLLCAGGGVGGPGRGDEGRGGRGDRARPPLC